MLRWSAETTGRDVDIAAVADGSRDPGITSGRALGRLARAAAEITEPDPTALQDVTKEIGPSAASDAAAVAAAFEGLNRIVDGTGLPIGRAARRDQADIIAALGLASFPHASHGA